MIRSILLGFALSTVACGPPARGAIEPSGFRHKDYALAVSSKSGDLMPDGWMLDNFYEKAGTTGTTLKRKSTDDYTIEYKLDADGDGKYETEAKEFAYELRFTHKKHDGRVFLRTIPLSSNQGEKKLSVLLNRYVEAVAGAGYEVVVLGDSTIMLEKRYAVAVKDVHDSKLGGNEALVARLEVANLDQIKIDPKARKDQVVLVVAHTKFKYETDPRAGQVVKFPVLLLAGYANQPEDFESGLPDFWDFLDRIEIAGNKGFSPPKDQVDDGKGDEAELTQSELPSSSEDQVAPEGEVKSDETEEEPPSESPAPER